MNSRTSQPCTVILLAVILLLVACEPSRIESPLQSPLSPLVTLTQPTITEMAPTLIPTSTPYPTATPTPVLTITPTRTPSPTMMPTLTQDQLSPDAVAAMAVWKAIDNNAPYELHQISDTPLGVTSLEWSPSGRNLWLNIATGPGGWGNFADTLPLVVNVDIHTGWKAGARGDWFVCYRSHAWSPDGQQLAYVQQAGQLWIADANGQYARNVPLPAGAEAFSSPVYSSNGQLIAVQGGHSDGHTVFYDVWVINPVTGEAKRIIENSGSSRYAWSPVDDTLAVLGESSESTAYPIGAAHLWVIDVDNDHMVSMDLASLPGTEGCLSDPAWVQHGQKVLAGGYMLHGLWLVDRNGQVESLTSQQDGQSYLHPRGMASPQLGGPTYYALPSPDGRYVIYNAGNTGVYVRDFESGKDISIKQAFLGSDDPRITWSSLGPQFLIWGEAGTLFKLVSAADGSYRSLSADGILPAWSPDGQQIAYWSPQSDGWALRAFDLNLERDVTLIWFDQMDLLHSQTWRPYEYDVAPHWSPDGNALAFIAWRGEHPEAYILSTKAK